MAKHIVHTGVALTYLAERVRALGNKQDLVEANGKPVSMKAALTWIQGQLDACKKVTSSCPSPMTDGSCPGHRED